MSEKANILVGVCGGISAYKTCELVRQAKVAHYAVKVVMTETALRFVGEATFQALSGNAVYTDLFASCRENIPHIALSDWADVCVIAPASANTISKIASGICDNLLLSVVCALPGETPVILAPAMNGNMWRNPFIQKNVEALKSMDKYHVLSPAKGPLACGDNDTGRMPEAEAIFDAVKKIRS